MDKMTIGRPLHFKKKLRGLFKLDWKKLGWIDIKLDTAFLRFRHKKLILMGHMTIKKKKQFFKLFAEKCYVL